MFASDDLLPLGGQKEYTLPNHGVCVSNVQFASKLKKKNCL
jgi:hypothetical protein